MKAKIFALVALVLGMVSCQKEINGIAVDKNGEAAVTISVALPEEGATRAGGADSAVGAIGNIDLENDYDIRYILEVYDENGNLAKGPITNYEDNSTSTSFTLRLVPGRDYKFVVWADFTAQGVEESLHYDTSNLAEVKLKGNMDEHKLMDETRDAYTGTLYVEDFSSTSDVNVPLTRPFAKLRVVTTDMNEIYSNLENAVVTYTTPINTTFNAIAGVKGDTYENVAKTVYYGNSRYYSNEDGKGQMTLFADYLFGTEDGTVQFTLDVEDAVAAIPKVIFNTNIPVQRNYLTTVTGPILTDSNNITVTIEEGFYKPDYEVEYVKAASAEELAEAIENAEDGTETVIEIADDIVFGNSASTTSTRAQEDNGFIFVPKGKTISINLNGKNIIGTENTAKNFGLIQNNGNLTISGEGRIELTATQDSGWNRYSAVISNNPGAELTVNEGVVIEHRGGTDMAYGIDALTNNNLGAVKTTINGATVVSTYRAVRQFLNSDSTQNELVVKAGTALYGARGNKSIFFHDPSTKANLGKLVVEEGAMLYGDVYLFVTEGSTEWPVEVSIAASALHNSVLETCKVTYKNVPAGYAVVEKAGNYVVEKGFEVNGNEVAISSATGLEWVAAEVNNRNNYFEGKNVVLTADIDLAGYNWTPIGSATQDHGFMGNFNGNGYTIKNLNIDEIALDSDDYAYAGLFGVTEGVDENNQNTIKNFTIENVNISTKGHIVAAAIAYPYYTVVENVTVKGDIQIDGGNYVAGVLGYTRRCVNAKNLVVEAKANSSISGGITIGGVLSDLQMNGGLKADYSNFKASGLTINGNQLVGGISGIIGGQTLNGATVENVTICCSDVRKGQIAGAVGEESFITEANVKNVAGAENLVGATYDSGKTGKVTIDGVEYEYKADGTIVCTVAELNGEKYNSLAEAFAVAATMENAEVKLLADAEWATGAGIGSTPFIAEGAKTQVLTINGNGKTFTATGNGVGTIRMANGGKLVFNNVVIVDKSVSYAENSWEYGYLEFAGNLEFNNCKVENAIMVENGGNATFNSCEFNSYKENEYDVWVSEAKAYFNNCDVNGYRGIKVHEAYGSEVEEVVIDGCRFNNLTKKPGVALGTLNAETIIKIMNSTFTNCKAGDQGLYIYETDTDVTTFTFVNENNTVL
ncbi:MAG: FimB/Mfa2 family fimbrial subunit [Alistipes sp.]|nr:FimB/Mfa2 family fimbrial subunit [Alistipes sp.]